jgi:hypothetical protein
MDRRIEEDKRLWIPPQVERSEPVDGDSLPEDKNVHINTVPGEVEVADEDALRRVIETKGRFPEPEIARARLLKGDEPEIGTQSYAQRYWTHFDFREDVAAGIVRVQKQFPWETYANTYYEHPPVYGRTYEFVSVDYWGGGFWNGRYAGYRGKPIGVGFGWEVFNAAFNDPYLPNIYWAIFNGYMWTRGYGWGPSPWGPPDSDPRHDKHIHISYLL